MTLNKVGMHSPITFTLPFIIIVVDSCFCTPTTTETSKDPLDNRSYGMKQNYDAKKNSP